jgi:hypothetical protein
MAKPRGWWPAGLLPHSVEGHPAMGDEDDTPGTGSPLPRDLFAAALLEQAAQDAGAKSS